MILEAVIQEPSVTLSSLSDNFTVNLDTTEVSNTIVLTSLTTVPQSILDRIEELEKSGWIYFINTTHTEANPFTFTANTEFNLPLINDSSLITNASDDLRNYILNGKLQPTNEGDFGFMRFEFNLNTDLANRSGKMNFDIGVSSRFNNSRFVGSEDADAVEPVSIPVPYFVGNTFIQNGADVKCIIDGDGGLYDITILIGRLIHGEDI